MTFVSRARSAGSLGLAVCFVFLALVPPVAASDPLEEFRAATQEYLEAMEEAIRGTPHCARVTPQSEYGDAYPFVDSGGGDLVVSVAVAPGPGVDPGDPFSSGFERVSITIRVNNDVCEDTSVKMSHATILYLERTSNLFTAQGPEYPDLDPLVALVRSLVPDPIPGPAPLPVVLPEAISDGNGG